MNADDLSAVIRRAFPVSLAGDVGACARIVPIARPWSAGEIAVRVESEQLFIPHRIYNDELGLRAMAELSPRAQIMIHGLYTRHHDGHIRQRHLEQVVAAQYLWAVPYVIQLVGEYVVEIIEVIEAALTQLIDQGSWQQASYGRFAAENPAFIKVTQARVASYWNAYYRRQYQSIADYPGHRFMVRLETAAREYATVNRPGLPPGVSLDTEEL